MFRKVHVGIVPLLLVLATLQAPASAETLRVMTFNIWVGGESSGLPLERVADVIRAARADVVGIQESHGEFRNWKSNDAARDIAAMLGWNYFDQGDNGRVIVSRYKIVGHTSRNSGAALELPDGRRVWMFNAHFMHTPYQPYQLLKIPYNDSPFITTEAQAIDEAKKTRADEVAVMLADIESVRSEKTPMFLTGDFNEPSCLDWTAAAAEAGRCPLAVRWPSTAAFVEAGFVDAFRQFHPDPVKAPGHTWTPLTRDDDPNDRHDRIDFVFVRGENVKIVAAEVVGESPERADIVATPYPSDHRAVVATVELDSPN